MLESLTVATSCQLTPAVPAPHAAALAGAATQLRAGLQRPADREHKQGEMPL